MDIDINTLRSVTTLVSFVVFVAILRWTWSKRRSDDFHEAANLPFDQE